MYRTMARPCEHRTLTHNTCTSQPGKSDHSLAVIQRRISRNGLWLPASLILPLLPTLGTHQRKSNMFPKLVTQDAPLLVSMCPTSPYPHPPVCSNLFFISTQSVEKCEKAVLEIKKIPLRIFKNSKFVAYHLSLKHSCKGMILHLVPILERSGKMVPQC